MLQRFDHIIRNALENLETFHQPDWKVFHDLLRIEENLTESDEALDEIAGDSLRSLDHWGSSLSAWSTFENQLDDLNAKLDAEFDREISSQLENLTDFTWTSTSWEKMSGRLDDLNAEMDAEFDEAIGNALENTPDPGWKEQHWQMLSVRLDRLNNRPRILMMKLLEAAAIILLLVQLTNLYTGIQQNRSAENNLTHILENLVRPTPEAENTNSAGDATGSKDPQGEFNEDATSHIPAVSELQKELPVSQSGNHTTQSRKQSIQENTSDRLDHHAVLPLEGPSGSDMQVVVSDDHLHELEERNRFLSRLPDYAAAPQLENDPHLISYAYDPRDVKASSPQLGVRDISLLSLNSTDSILNSIPTLQVIKPRLHSSMEVGVLADATNVEIRDYFSLSGPYQVSTLNAGVYFRYKIQYENMFGSLGGDYLNMKYDGLSNDNELSMVTLPLELGYNVVNLPSFRMYFSGGVAGRFVPVANYSTNEAFNQASIYVRKSQKASNGLLKDGPFEINSYLSGRLSMGLDINVNKKTSVNLRFSHDIWLKGGGLGYNRDKFRSSHLAIGTNFHF